MVLSLNISLPATLERSSSPVPPNSSTHNSDALSPRPTQCATPPGKTENILFILARRYATHRSLPKNITLETDRLKFYHFPPAQHTWPIFRLAKLTSNTPKFYEVSTWKIFSRNTAKSNLIAAYEYVLHVGEDMASWPPTLRSASELDDVALGFASHRSTVLASEQLMRIRRYMLFAAALSARPSFWSPCVRPSVATPNPPFRQGHVVASVSSVPGTYAELPDIHLTYGADLGNAAETWRIYHERYPNRTFPSCQMCVNIDQRLRDLGSLSANMCDTVYRRGISYVRGVCNAHNNHVWALDNQYATFEHGAHERYAVNLRCYGNFYNMCHWLCDARSGSNMCPIFRSNAKPHHITGAQLNCKRNANSVACLRPIAQVAGCRAYISAQTNDHRPAVPMFKSPGRATSNRQTNSRKIEEWSRRKHLSKCHVLEEGQQCVAAIQGQTKDSNGDSECQKGIGTVSGPINHCYGDSDVLGGFCGEHQDSIGTVSDWSIMAMVSVMYWVEQFFGEPQECIGSVPDLSIMAMETVVNSQNAKNVSALFRDRSNLAIEKVIYSENAKNLSALFRDESIMAMETVMSWVDYSLNAKKVSALFRDQSIMCMDTVWMEESAGYVGYTENAKKVYVLFRKWSNLTIEKVIYLVDYSENDKKVSELIRDRSLMALETEMYWLELVSRQCKNIRKLSAQFRLSSLLAMETVMYWFNNSENAMKVFLLFRVRTIMAMETVINWVDCSENVMKLSELFRVMSLIAMETIVKKVSALFRERSIMAMEIVMYWMEKIRRQCTLLGPVDHGFEYSDVLGGLFVQCPEGIGTVSGPVDRGYGDSDALGGLSQQAMYGVVNVVSLFSLLKLLGECQDGYSIVSEPVDQGYGERDVLSLVCQQAYYSENAEKVSALIRDRSLFAKETVMYWLDYSLNARKVSPLVGDRSIMSVETVMYWVDYSENAKKVSALFREGSKMAIEKVEQFLGECQDSTGTVSILVDHGYGISDVLGGVKNAKKVSALFRDRIVTTMETVVYWMVYLIIYSGALHMRSAAANMPLYQYLLLDVIICIFVAYCTIRTLINAITNSIVARKTEVYEWLQMVTKESFVVVTINFFEYMDKWTQPTTCELTPLHYGTPTSLHDALLTTGIHDLNGFVPYQNLPSALNKLYRDSSDQASCFQYSRVQLAIS
ncbi:hypothetical protein PR048_015159 [Dryococelus australis]|uniref:Uncharacterized protein n=1 Tax=Dryococelus australis TaxID=614101 RepID=A0ABQ9HG68_9NEOP|nr:hypothetical protein PR048_015159 [Dryococelus australis]